MMKNNDNLLIGCLATAVAATGGMIGYLVSERKKNKLLQQIVDKTAKELNNQLNEEIIEKNRLARKQLIKKADNEREELIKDINKQIDIKKIKREIIEKIDEDLIDDILAETKKLVKEVKVELEKERNDLRKNYCDFTNNVTNRLDKMNVVNPNNVNVNGNEKKAIRDLDFNTRCKIDDILKDNTISAADKALLIEALR